MSDERLVGRIGGMRLGHHVTALCALAVGWHIEAIPLFVTARVDHVTNHAHMVFRRAIISSERQGKPVLV